MRNSAASQACRSAPHHNHKSGVECALAPLRAANRLCACSGLFAPLLLVFFSILPLHAQSTSSPPLEIARPVRPWDFLSVLGTRAGVLGAETGRFEAWAYPLKVLRDFHLTFLSEGHVISADALVRSIIVRPEGTTLIYSGDTFSLRETIFVPREKAGILIRLDLETSQPLEIGAVFEKDFQLEWPAPLAQGSIDFVPRLNAFALSDPEGRFSAVVGSPSGHEYQEEYSTNAVSLPQSSFKLGVVAKGSATKLIAIAASSSKSLEAEALYHDLLQYHDQWQNDDAMLYRQYLDSNLKLTLPDRMLEQAYQWAQVSMLQGVVENPFLGTGLVAGYDTSGVDSRPGYAWFFGRDALWTSFALTAEGDSVTSRKAIEFLANYQRADGKVPHEIAQGASFVPWFTKLPYAFASADATPLFIIAVEDYVRRSGDVQFASVMWDNVWRAYQFLTSTYDERGFPRNAGVGHGWIEGGPLYPLRSELYQSGVGLEAIRSLAQLARVLGKEPLAADLDKTFARKSREVDDAFWMETEGHYALGLDLAGQQVNVPSVLATVPMWFGLLDPQRSDKTITELSGPNHATDWGMRILSTRNSHFDPSGYHWGSVWPLFTGWASVGEFRYHRPLPALQNLQANALLTFEGAPGHVAEVLSGSYYGTLQTASPNQIWSSAMVVSPLLRGLLGLSPDALQHTLRFAPHVPGDWSAFRADNVAVGPARLSLAYSRTASAISLVIGGNGEPCQLTFAPALSLRAHVRRVTLDGKPIQFHLEPNANDQHLETSFKTGRQEQRLVVQVDDDFAMSEPATLPLLGETSRGVRVLSETWSQHRDILSLRIAGSAGSTYNLGVWNPRQIASVEGGELSHSGAEQGTLRVDFANGGPEDAAKVVTIHFRGRGKNSSADPAKTTRSEHPVERKPQ